jgi:hypothetical protein
MESQNLPLPLAGKTVSNWSLDDTDDIDSLELLVLLSAAFSIFASSPTTRHMEADEQRRETQNNNTNGTIKKISHEITNERGTDGDQNPKHRKQMQQLRTRGRRLHAHLL